LNEFEEVEVLPNEGTGLTGGNSIVKGVWWIIDDDYLHQTVPHNRIETFNNKKSRQGIKHRNPNPSDLTRVRVRVLSSYT